MRELSVKSKKRNSVSFKLRREWDLIIFLFWHRARNIRRKIRLEIIEIALILNFYLRELIVSWWSIVKRLSCNGCRWRCSIGSGVVRLELVHFCGRIKLALLILNVGIWRWRWVHAVLLRCVDSLSSRAIRSCQNELAELDSSARVEDEVDLRGSFPAATWSCFNITNHVV